MQQFDKAMDLVCKHFSVKKQDVIGPSRFANLVRARQFFCKLIYSDKENVFSLTRIGTYLGDRDHSTIINSLEKFDIFYDCEDAYKKQYDDLEKKYIEEFGDPKLFYWAKKITIEYPDDTLQHITAHVYTHEQPTPFYISAIKPVVYRITKAIPIKDTDWQITQ